MKIFENNNDHKNNHLLNPAHFDFTFSPYFSKFVAGALAGSISTTLVAPIDCIRILMQANRLASPPISAVVAQLWRQGGPRAFFRGNLANLIRFGPESALMFSLFDASCARLCPPALARGPSLPERFLAGAFAGTAAQTVTYPLITVRVVMAVSPRESYRGVLHCAQQIYRAQGLRGLYAGNLVSVCGSIPYAAVELGTFSHLKHSLVQLYHAYLRGEGDGADDGEDDEALFLNDTIVSPRGDAQRISTPALPLIAAGMASSLSALLLTYPFWTVRTLLQTQRTPAATHLSSPLRKFSGTIDCFRTVYAHHGFKGYYRGLIPSIVRLLPAQSLNYTLFTKLSEFFVS